MTTVTSQDCRAKQLWGKGEQVSSVELFVAP